MNDWPKILAELAFAAGTLWAIVRGLRKDVNGLGKRARDDHVTMEFRTLTSMMTTLVNTEKRDDRQWLVDKYLNAWRRP